MKRSIFLVMSLVLAIVVISQSSSRQSLAAAEEAPYYNQQPGISACTYTPAGAFATLPCFTTDENTADSYSMRLGQCTSTLTNFCYTAKMDGADVPSGLRFMVTVGAYKTHTSSEGIAGYEA